MDSDSKDVILKCNIIKDNIISNNTYGIRLKHSHGAVINDNKISSKSYGISLHSCHYTAIVGNSFFNTGLIVHHSYENTVSKNTVNGKPLLYLEKKSNKIVDPGAGQIILVNCYNITIQNQQLCFTNVGIELWATYNCSIIHNNISSNSDGGIYLCMSGANIISSNNISNNDEESLLLLNSDYNLITNNIINGSNIGGEHITGFFRNGICLDRANNNTISDNILLNHWCGIRLETSSDNNINNNTIFNNRVGIDLWSSDRNNLAYNHILNHRSYGIYILSSTNTNISKNIIFKNYNGLKIGDWIDGWANKNIIIGNNIVMNKKWGIRVFGAHNIITCNNFINNPATFVCEWRLVESDPCPGFSNSWIANYWGRRVIIPPKIICGGLWTCIEETWFYEKYIPIPWLNFDWLPAREPYDIS
jgi:parallel beta-helix repeat protein